MRILLVEDDRAIADPLKEILTYEGFEVVHHSTATAVLGAVDDADLVLLDLGLPDLDGMEVCRRIRVASKVPIIVVTARGEEYQRVLGLELGADDYVVKPFSQRELVARIRAVLRRLSPAADEPGSGAGTTEAEETATSEVGPLRVDRRSRRVTLDGAAIELTAKEFDVLALLAGVPGTVLTRQDILEAVWDANWYGPTKTVDAHIAAVRRKLGRAEWIAAVRGVGFRLEVPNQ